MALQPGPRAASNLERQAVRKLPRQCPQVRNIGCWYKMNDRNSHNKRYFITSDEQYSPLPCARLAAAGHPSADGAARLRARRFAVELPPRRARPGAQPVGD